MKGDGRKYGFTIESHNGGFGPYFRYDFVAAEEWKEYYFPFDEFGGKYFGRDIGQNFNQPELVRRIGIILSDKKPGKFALELDWIAFE